MATERLLRMDILERLRKEAEKGKLEHPIAGPSSGELVEKPTLRLKYRPNGSIYVDARNDKEFMAARLLGLDPSIPGKR